MYTLKVSYMHMNGVEFVKQQHEKLYSAKSGKKRYVIDK